VLGHISFGVRSYLRSKCFYTAIFRPLDIVPIYDNAVLTTLSFGFDGDHEVFNIYEYSKLARPPGRGSHFCFNAPTRRAVREWWDAGCKNGGRDDGAPGVREEFGGFYYAAYLTDPDGWRLEVVCQEMDGEP
jgi:catechol 2,3-dioxygenase-like lactoylglutathione lyase family enzyme